METIQLTVNDRLAVISLDRGRSNPINHQMVKELTACVQSLESDHGVGGLILTGKPGFFSSGVDLIEAFNYNEDESRAFWIDFFALQKTLVSFSKPMVAAISGHSPAGGCVMAICCDYRVMPEGKFVIGLNEIPVGIIVPESIFALYSFWLGRRKAYQYLMEGKLLTVYEALQSGLINEICPPEGLMEVAEKRVRGYMQHNANTWSQSKLNLRREVIEKLSGDQTGVLNKMLKQWWAPETRQILGMLVQNLKAKSSGAN